MCQGQISFHKIQTHPSFNACSCYMKASIGSNQKQQRKSGNTILPITPEPLYNTVRYNTVLDITRIRTGPQMAIKDSFTCITYAFYSQYNTVWITNTEIGLDPENSVIKRLWCIRSIGVFLRCSRAANSVVGGPIWLRFELIHNIMHVLVTSKFEKDRININRDYVMTSIF